MSFIKNADKHSFQIYLYNIMYIETLTELCQNYKGDCKGDKHEMSVKRFQDCFKVLLYTLTVNTVTRRRYT